jgi:hypothetical protein
MTQKESAIFYGICGGASVAFKDLKSATKKGSRLEQLKTLANELARSIDLASGDIDSIKQLAPLAKQYRETIREIEEIEEAEVKDDAISEIIADRADHGKPGAVRKDRTKLRE